MKGKPPTYCLTSESFDRLDLFVDRFLSEGFEAFAKEFANIDQFVEFANADHSERDDHSLRQSEKARYLLEIVSFAMYDRLNREAFNKTENTLIVMPDCLSLHNEKCEKKDTEWGDVCIKCTSTCQANGISLLAKKYKARVIFSKRKLADQIEHYSESMPNLGVIGVACIMMLAAGMRKAAETDIPARGVLLNCTGCDHWNDESFASDFDLIRLEAILREKQSA